MKKKIAINFKIDKEDKVLTILSDRCDTLYGVTYLLISAKDKIVSDLNLESNKEVKEYLSSKNNSTGVFTNYYGINPINEKKIPIYISKNISEAKMGVPLHNEEDYAFATSNNLPMIQVIEEVTGTPHDNEFTKNSIVAIVHDEQNDKYLTINWHDKGGRLFIGGTIKEGEEPLACALREVEEETGYTNLEVVKTLPKINHHYYAYNKDKYFNIECTGFLFKLVDDTKNSQNLDEDEVFTVEWVDKETAMTEIKDDLHRKTYEYASNLQTIINDGIHINSGIINGMYTEEAINTIEKWLKENN